MASHQDMMSLDGLLASQSHSPEEAEHQQLLQQQQRIQPASAVVDLAKHPSGIVPTLQYAPSR